MRPEEKKYILENMNKRSVKDLALDLNLKERKVKKFLEKKSQKASAADFKDKERVRLNKGIILLSLILIAVVGFSVYSCSLNGEFIWDDYYLIKDNTFIKSFSYIPDMFKSDIAAGSGKQSNSYRPLQTLSYMLDYQIWKLNQKGYHITNVILHILAAFSIYWLINILYDNKRLSLFTALLFVAHPIHTEAVSYIAGRADPMALLFMLLSFAFYIKYTDHGRKAFFPLMLLAYIAALLSRESSIIFPALLVLYRYSFKKKINMLGLGSVSIITFIYLLIRATALRSILPHITSETALLERLPGSFVAITNYLRLIIFPIGLHMEYELERFSMANPRAILGVALAAAILVYIFKNREKKRLIFFSISWFFLSLVPSLNIYPLNAYMAEHWLYLPSVGFFLLAAGGLDYLYRDIRFEKIAIVFIIILTTAYSFMTTKQNRYWRDAFSFYQRTLEYSPNNIRVLNSLGLLYHEKSMPDEAINMYKKAIGISPGYIDAYNNLGIVYRNLGRIKEAIQIYNKAIEMRPDFVYTYCNLANAYKDMGMKEEAIALYKKAIEIYPNFSYAYNNLGLSYKDFGRTEEAIASYKKAIELKPDYMEAYSNLGALYFNLGRKEEALAMFEKAIQLNPYNAKAYGNLGASYSDAGKRKEAIEAFKNALRFDPNYALAHYNLAVTYMNEKEYDLAVQHYDKAISLGYKDDSNLAQVLTPYRRQ